YSQHLAIVARLLLVREGRAVRRGRKQSRHRGRIYRPQNAGAALERRVASGGGSKGSGADRSRNANPRYHYDSKLFPALSKAGRPGTVTISTNMAGRGTDIKLGPGVTERGGLYVIGTERHESRRIDRQLRGRCARQGDPGASRFYVSFEDDLMRNFGAADRMT